MNLQSKLLIGIFILLQSAAAAPVGLAPPALDDPNDDNGELRSYDLAGDTPDVSLATTHELEPRLPRLPAWVFSGARLVGTYGLTIVGARIQARVERETGVEDAIEGSLDVAQDYVKDALDKARDKFQGACSTPEPGKRPTCIMPSNEHVPLTSEIIKAIQNAKPECQKQAALNVAAPKFPLTTGASKSRRGLRDVAVNGALAANDNDTEDETDTDTDTDADSAAMCPPAVFQTEDGAALCLGPFKTPKACAKFAKSVLKDSFGGKDAGEATKTRTKPKGLAAATSKLKSSAKSAKALKKTPAKKPAADSEAGA